jgi:hypothetical protein
MQQRRRRRAYPLRNSRNRRLTSIPAVSSLELNRMSSATLPIATTSSRIPQTPGEASNVREENLRSHSHRICVNVCVSVLRRATQRAWKAVQSEGRCTAPHCTSHRRRRRSSLGRPSYPNWRHFSRQILPSVDESGWKEDGFGFPDSFAVESESFQRRTRGCTLQ